MLESSKLGAGLATIGLAEAGVGIGVKAFIKQISQLCSDTPYIPLFF